MNNLNIKNMLLQYQNVSISEQKKFVKFNNKTALLGLEKHGFFEKILLKI